MHLSRGMRRPRTAIAAPQLALSLMLSLLSGGGSNHEGVYTRATCN